MALPNQAFHTDSLKLAGELTVMKQAIHIYLKKESYNEFNTISESVVLQDSRFRFFIRK